MNIGLQKLHVNYGDILKSQIMTQISWIDD